MENENQKNLRFINQWTYQESYMKNCLDLYIVPNTDLVSVDDKTKGLFFGVFLSLADIMYDIGENSND